MKLLKKNGKGTFNLPDKLAQRLVDKGKFQRADEPEEIKGSEEQASEPAGEAVQLPEEDKSEQLPEVKQKSVGKGSGRGKGNGKGKK